MRQKSRGGIIDLDAEDNNVISIDSEDEVISTTKKDFVGTKNLIYWKLLHFRQLRTVNLRHLRMHQPSLFRPIRIAKSMGTLHARININSTNIENQIIQLANPMRLRTIRAAIMVILVVGKAVGVMIIATITIGDDTNSTNNRMGLINRTHPHHQVSSHVDRIRDDNGCASLRIRTVFEYYDFLFKIFCGTSYSHQLVLWLLRVYFWCIINLLWFSSAILWWQCRTVYGGITHFSSIVLFVVNFQICW